jgi:hypothetical protein
LEQWLVLLFFLVLLFLHCGIRMVRKNKSTRRNRKQEGGGFLSYFGFGSPPAETITPMTEVVPPKNTKPGFFDRMFGKKNTSTVPAAVPVSLSTAQEPINPTATAPATAPVAVGGRRRKATRKSKGKGKKSRKSKTSRKH